MKDKGIQTFAIVIVVVVAIGAVAGGYVIMSGDGDDTSTNGESDDTDGVNDGTTNGEEDGTTDGDGETEFASLYLVASGQDTESEWEGKQKVWIRKTGGSAIDGRIELYKDGELVMIDILNYEEKKGYAYYPKQDKWESGELTTENIEEEAEEHIEPYWEKADNYDEGDQYMNETIKWEIITIERDIEIADDKFTPPEDADL